MKKCPYCAEEIQDAAIKCKHCHEFLNGPLHQHAQPIAKDPVPWYCKTSSILITLFCMPPFALPLIWLHPTLKPLSKIIWTLVTAGLTALTILSIIKAIKLFQEMSEMIGSF